MVYTGAVLIDNWTLHDITYLPGSSYNDVRHMNDLENLLMAILLWDEICFWDNGKTVWWKEAPQAASKLPPLTGLVLTPEVDFKISSIQETDVIASGAQRYLLIAEQYGLDYLPKRERYQYLTSQKHYRLRNVVWQKFFVEEVEKSVREYYQDLVKIMGNAQLSFQFPLLLDYIRSQSGDGDYITAALHMRQTGPLYNMRSWIENLHNCIDSGNWAEVKYSIKNVKDVVSAVHSPLIKDVQFQLILPPAAGVSFRSGRHGTQLTFLHDLAEFAIKKRPES